MTAKFSEYEFRTQPWFDQDNFKGFNDAIPMKTMVICCFDPRATEVPQIVAEHFGDEVYPGQNVLDEHGNKVGHTRTLFAVYCAGGRAASALQSVATMDYLFNVRKVVVVHHSFCGATGFRADQLIDRYRDCHHVDIASLFDRESLAISNFEESLKHDLGLLRASSAVPKTVELYGFFYEMNEGVLIEVARDIPS